MKRIKMRIWEKYRPLPKARKRLKVWGGEKGRFIPHLLMRHILAVIWKLLLPTLVLTETISNTVSGLLSLWEEYVLLGNKKKIQNNTIKELVTFIFQTALIVLLDIEGHVEGQGILSLIQSLLLVRELAITQLSKRKQCQEWQRKEGQMESLKKKLWSNWC